MSADPLKEKLAKLVARWRHFADQSGNNSWSDGINRCADELVEAALAAHSAAPIEREALQALLDSCTKRRGGTQTLTMPSWKAVEDAEIALGQHVNQAGQDKPTRAGEPK